MTAGNIDATNAFMELPYTHLLSPEQIQLLISNLNTVKYRKKDIIFRQDTRTSHIMFVKSGMVKIFKSGRNEKIIILKLETAGEYIGLMSVFGEKLHNYSAEAITDAEICDIDITVFRNILAENGKFTLHLLNKISLDGLFIFDKLLSYSHKQLPGRIADVILYFSEKIYHSETFEFPFTRKELADFAGTTKESFIRTLTEFKNDKIIRLDGPEIEIISMDIIKTLSTLG